MRTLLPMIAGLSLCTGTTPSAKAAEAAQITVVVWTLDENGPVNRIGTLEFTDTPHGVLVQPKLRGLSPGLHALHVHEHPNCAAVAMPGHVMIAGAAGEHYDPERTGRHLGPYANGHLGDLPNLTAEEDGTANVPVLAPRIKTTDLLDRAVVIHAGADRYSDTEGGHDQHKGGERMYCGVIR